MTATDGRKAVDTLKVRDAKDVEEVVRAAIASEQPLEIIGHGSKRLIGQPMATNAVLDTSALNAVTSYEPNELIITVQSGAPLADVQSLIDSKNQQFAFEPMDTAVLLGVPGSGTIGGMHQEREYPGRVCATSLRNPDFATYARAFGGFGVTVEKTEDFPAAFKAAAESGIPAIVHLKIDPDAITPVATLTQIRERALQLALAD